MESVAAVPAPADHDLDQSIVNGDPINMLWTIGLALIAIVALTVLSFTLHVLLSPWVLVVAIGVLAWIKFRPRRSHR
jgi:Flp pilus assembly protein TadB